MEEIKCTSYEKREFLRILRYAKEMKMQTKVKQGRFDDTLYDIQQIDLLIQRVEGKVPYQNYQRDSLSYTHDCSNKEREEQIYKKDYYNNVVKGKSK